MQPEEKPAGRLAEGPIRRWVKGKPRLAASTPALASAGVQTRKQSSEILYNLGVLFRAGVVLFVMTLIVAIASWFILVLTVLATPNIQGNFWTVQKIAWVQGEAPVGDRIVILPEKVATNIGGTLLEVVTNYPDAAVVDVVAQPTDSVSTNVSGILFVNGEKTKIEIPSGVAIYDLGNEYLTVCVAGPCGEPGDAVIVPVENTLGKVIGNTDFKNNIVPPLEY